MCIIITMKKERVCAAVFALGCLWFCRFAQVYIWLSSVESGFDVVLLHFHEKQMEMALIGISHDFHYDFT